MNVKLCPFILFRLFFQGILHDRMDEDCVKLLKNCYSATPEDGKVIVLRRLFFQLRQKQVLLIRSPRTQLDVFMMTLCPGGKERTQLQELMDLATRAGFSSIKYECFVANIWVMEFVKQ